MNKPEYVDPKAFTERELTELGRLRVLERNDAVVAEIAREEVRDKLTKQTRELLNERPDRGVVPTEPPDLARELAIQETRSLRRFSPRRNRWKELQQLDRRLAELEREQGARIREQQRLTNEIPAVEVRDRDALAQWLADGSPGERPEPELLAHEEAIARARAEVQAYEIAVDNVLADRVALVERHRRKLVTEAQAETAAARDAYQELVRRLADARTQLLEARQTETWCRLFPAVEAQQQHGNPHFVGLGLARVSRMIGTAAQIDFAAITAALLEDSIVLASVLSKEQKKLLGTEEPATPESEAMWSTDERAVAWGKEKLERARSQAHALNIDSLGAELRE